MHKTILTVLFVFLSVSVARAHSVWINAFLAEAHQPPHVMLSLGWGHMLPMDDVLNSASNRMEIDSFALFDPALQKTSLVKPSPAPVEAAVTTKDFTVSAADLAVQKVAFNKDSAPGVYQFGLTSKPRFYTQYIDTRGRQRMQLKPRDEISDIDTILRSVRFTAFAKSCVTIGEWQDPKPLGQGLEIIPRTDLSNLHSGDLVEVDVLFYGKPLTTTAKNLDFITAYSDSFGQSEGFKLFSYLVDGRARFRVQSAGQWIVTVHHKGDVTAAGPLKELMGKAEQVYHNATLTFTVK